MKYIIIAVRLMNNELRQKCHSMAIQKIKTIPVVLFLASGIFIESVMSGICFCGRCYSDSIQDRHANKFELQ
jgi:hypothetical protein